ncbi:MAG: hypothetical protein L0322_17680, partial [Chloroflexi bacterium]|nr:hypothetical protein [Chloroflexota bacterium]
MFCPHCLQPNPADAAACQQCQKDISHLSRRLFLGQQFVFALADEQRPLTLKVGEAVQTFRSPAILSRHRQAVGLGSEAGRADNPGLLRRLLPGQARRPEPPDQPQLPPPSLHLLTLVSDRKIYRPDTEASLLIIAPDAAGQEASLEVMRRTLAQELVEEE